MWCGLLWPEWMCGSDVKFLHYLIHVGTKTKWSIVHNVDPQCRQLRWPVGHTLNTLPGADRTAQGRSKCLCWSPQLLSCNLNEYGWICPLTALRWTCTSDGWDAGPTSAAPPWYDPHSYYSLRAYSSLIREMASLLPELHQYLSLLIAQVAAWPSETPPMPLKLLKVITTIWNCRLRSYPLFYHPLPVSSLTTNKRVMSLYFIPLLPTSGHGVTRQLQNAIKMNDAFTILGYVITVGEPGCDKHKNGQTPETKGSHTLQGKGIRNILQWIWKERKGTLTTHSYPCNTHTVIQDKIKVILVRMA